ncbi:MAG: glycosyltransferase [Pseudorhodobacter sp.]
MKIYGHCRFSYFGTSDTGKAVQTLDDAKALLWNAERMAVRFHLFEKLMLPSLRAQTDDGFQFVVTTSEEMPDIYQARLDTLIEGVPNCRILRTSSRNINFALRPIMREASDDHQAPAIHFRLDDDDALCTSYVERLRDCASGLRPSTMITFPRGILGHTDAGVARHRAFSKHGIAIGLALVKDAKGTRSPFGIQHRAYAQDNPVYCDPTFPAYHYTRHTTNNTNGYDQRIHKSGGVVDIVAQNSQKVHPEFAKGAVTTDEAEAMIAEAFPYTDGRQMRQIVAETYAPDRLTGYQPV